MAEIAEPRGTDRRTLPTPDRDSAAYWAALANGELMLQHCRDCGHWTWPVRPLCSGCHGANLAWEASQGTGVVYSWVVTHQGYAPDLARIVPYTIALVRLGEQDDILIPGRYTSTEPIFAGLRVRAAPERVSADLGILNWAADQRSAAAPDVLKGTQP
jgi:uncharacterized OB-fold protein